MKFKLEDYEPVEDRIKRFYADHPDGRVQSDIISPLEDISTVVVKAYLYVGDTLVSTGLAFEKAGEGFVNKTSHLENCETSAIGRALANYNYCGKRPSREEMEKVERNSVSPRDEVIAKITEQVKAGSYTDAEKEQLRKDIKTSDLKGLEDILETLIAGDYFFDDDIPEE